MNILTIEPHIKLKQVVKYFWYSKVEKNKTTYKILADGAPGLIFQHHNGNSTLFNPTIDSYLPVSFAYGQITESYINHITDDTFIFGVNFHPTAFKKIFSIDASEITNSLIEIEYLFSRQFSDRVLEVSNPEQIMQLFSEQLYRKIVNSKQDTTIDQSVKLLFEQTEDINSKVLSTHLNISRRQFQRKFKEQIGVSLETYLRIIKFQKSIHQLLTNQPEKLSNIAYSLNYADQSHFIREFKQFSGCTPKEFLDTVNVENLLLNETTNLFKPLRIVENKN